MSYGSAKSPGAEIDAEREGLEDLEDALQLEIEMEENTQVEADLRGEEAELEQMRKQSYSGRKQ